MKKEIVFKTEQEFCEGLMEHGLFDQYLKVRDYERKLLTEFCLGQSMELLTYDSIFKHIFQADGNNQRLEHFLTAVLGFEVHVEQVLPLESPKLVESGSVLYLDILVKTGDGSIINVEMQKYPFKFSGERESCYQADMIMRQYNSRKHEAKECGRVFDYKEMRPVYTIILLEKSYYDFLKDKKHWKHEGKIQFNTGVQLNYLPHITYIALDKFRELEQNIDTEQNRWIYLFSANTPERISRAAAISEEFFEILCDISKFCMDVSEVFSMFSEALRIMDKNTQELMYAEAMEELTEVREKLTGTTEKLTAAKEKLTETEGKLTEAEGKLTETEGKLAETEGKLTETEEELILIKKIYGLLMSGKTMEEVAVLLELELDRVKELLQ